MGLTELCEKLNNWFDKERYFGVFTIEGGTLPTDFLQDNQYFRIVGSVFNDGVYQYPAVNLTDEVFDGAVWAMAVPPNVIALAAEIDDWIYKYGDSVNSPYSSESFGGYSYTKASKGGSGNNGTSSNAGWADVFASRLNEWRKMP